VIERLIESLLEMRDAFHDLAIDLGDFLDEHGGGDAKQANRKEAC
jgi:hypothetical protein